LNGWTCRCEATKENGKPPLNLFESHPRSFTGSRDASLFHREVQLMTCIYEATHNMKMEEVWTMVLDQQLEQVRLIGSDNFGVRWETPFDLCISILTTTASCCILLVSYDLMQDISLEQQPELLWSNNES
jgi:hypothetical protein